MWDTEGRAVGREKSPALTIGAKMKSVWAKSSGSSIRVLDHRALSHSKTERQGFVLCRAIRIISAVLKNL